MNGELRDSPTDELDPPPTRTPGRTRVLVVAFLVTAAVALGALMLPARWAGQPAPGPSIAAAVMLQRALAAVSPAGETTPAATATTEGVVLHVVAETDFVSPARRLGGSFSGPGRKGMVTRAADASPDIVHVESEHWLDDANHRRHSLSASTFSRNSDRWSNELLVADGVRTAVHSQKPSRGATTTEVSETDDGDWFTLGDTSMADAKDQSPEQQLMDAANPLVYRSLLASGTVAPPSHTSGWRVESTTKVLGESEVDGVAVYSLRIDTATFFGKSTSAESTVSLVADLRRSDYLPVRVRGEFAGQTWTTVYRTVEWVPATNVPDDAFRLSIAMTATRRANHRVQPGSVASATAGAAVLWLGQQFEGLRFTGQFRTIDNTGEYEVMAETGSAAVMADESRPRINARYVVAEYTPDAEPGNMTRHLTETTIKVLTMPRTDSGTWEGAFATAASGMAGDRNPPDWVMETSWISVGGRKALLLHHAFICGDGSVDGRIRPTFDYLVFDLGGSTVMLQGACAKPGQVQRAAAALTLAK